MNKKAVAGGAVAVALSALGLYAVGKEAANNSAEQKPAIEAPVAPSGEMSAPVEETAPANEAVEQSEQSWSEWFSSWLPSGPSFEEETPADIQRRNLENNY